MKTYPRLTIRLNSKGRYDAYLLKSARFPEVWVSSGLTIAGALWWVPAPVAAPSCCRAA